VLAPSRPKPDSPRSRGRHPAHPLGIRGVGEVSIVPPPAAAANAIYSAIGIRLTGLPMSPPRILKAMLEKHALEDEIHSAAAD
jgi:hypothetical protein